MTDLDELSMMLGEIKSDLKYARKWFDEHEKNDQRRFEELAARMDATALLDADNNYKSRIEAIEVHVLTAKPVIEHIKKLRWIAAGFVMAIAILGGAGAGVATTAFKWFL
jgi:hypothetical protein